MVSKEECNNNTNVNMGLARDKASVENVVSPPSIFRTSGFSRSHKSHEEMLPPTAYETLLDVP